jgi:hypothetical protein
VIDVGKKEAKRKNKGKTKKKSQNMKTVSLGLACFFSGDTLNFYLLFSWY